MSHFREILNGVDVRSRILDAQHVEDLRCLLDCHPDRDEKIGSGVAWFYVDVSPEHPTRCFWIQRVDGTSLDFSIRAALDAAAELSV